MNLRARLGRFSPFPFTADERALLYVLLPIVWALSVALVIGYALQHELRAIAAQHGVRVLFRGWDGLAWLVWPVAAPVILLLIRRFPLSSGRLKRNLLRLVLGSTALYLVVTNVRMVLRLLPNLWLPPEQALPADLENYVVSILITMPLDLLTYCGFFSLSFAVNYYYMHRLRRDEALQLKLRTAQLESDLAHAELHALRGQLHPHFLFNSFNAVATLIRQQRNADAVEMIAQLGALLRLAIDRTGKQELTLEAEIDFIRRYLEVERIRFGDKLRLIYDLGPGVLSCRVPNLLLQPLVENAIKHGISRRREPGTLRFSAFLRAKWLVLEIENDGPQARVRSVEAEFRRDGGVGVSNTRSRLAKIYGADFLFDMLPRPDGGMLVKLELPCSVSDPIL